MFRFLGLFLIFYSCTGITPLKKSDVIKEEVSKEEVIVPHKEEPRELCHSVNNQKINYFEKKSLRKKPLKILVFSSVHGDEPSSTLVAENWIERLKKINPRSSWRIIPLLNPDGLDLKTRTNAHGVDINRNFPTKDFDKLALKYWREKKRSEKRRYPGEVGGSEPETKCALFHIEDFKPDFVIAIHAPYGILDFDGPPVPKPFTDYLIWRRFGNFPGSLGRFMWEDKKVPVLTIELKHADKVPAADILHKLQDMAGLMAIKSVDHIK